METKSKQPHTSSLRGRQIIERRKELEQELTDMLKETESDFTLEHVRDAIFHEEDNDDMIYPHIKLKCLLRKQIEDSLKLFGVGAWRHFPGRGIAGVSRKAKQEIV